MKTLSLFSVIAMMFVCSFALAQERKATASPQPIPTPAPAMKVETPDQSTQQQQYSDSKPASNSKKSIDKSSAPSPIIDNKIAISDPGTPADKKSSTGKKSSSGNQSTEKKIASEKNTNINPK